VKEREREKYARIIGDKKSGVSRFEAEDKLEKRLRQNETKGDLLRVNLYQ
jgi:hypothetical protein